MACNPSGGIKVVWMPRVALGSGPAAALCGPPVPSCVVGCGALAKASASQHLERWAMREAGFTEQRIPPAANGGRITGRCTTGPR
ncbi:hypothetical protein PAHAL_9G201200 [Panicum hallii]|uniref:Uncharacterized protein n=1 Tax=Panicum hallii TaxID=206008 RepID=A0A2S3IL27_9POAL|nr:hypothetical protein PAHAL_9G201200 [Panicum hallii]